MKNDINDKLKYLLKLLTMIFLITSPIFDMTFFHSRITTLIRIFIILVIFISTIFLYKDSRKNLKYIIIFYLLSASYLIVSYYHNKGFISLFPNNFNYSFISELFTVLKLVMPITFIYSLYYQRLTQKDYKIVFISWSLFISLEIIITNIFKISLSSYSENIIKYNIFEWNKNINYIESASKGYFSYANMTSLTLLMMLIYNFYFFIKDNFKFVVLIFLISISMLMLGTRVSSVGGLLTLTCLVLCYLFFVIIKKEKFNKHLFLMLPIIILWIIILPISPYKSRNIELNKYSSVASDNASEESLENNDSFNENATIEKGEYSKQEYIESIVNNELIPEHFYKVYYSYEYDPGFWINLIENTDESSINYRFLEEKMIKRVIEINNNKLDILLGISNSRIQNIHNLERDFVMQYYSFGIIGSIILLSIYLIMLILNIISLFRNFNFINAINLIANILFCFCACLTGNILCSMTMIIIYSFLSNYMINKDVKLDTTN